jgi:hypothetical protein
MDAAIPSVLDRPVFGVLAIVTTFAAAHVRATGIIIEIAPRLRDVHGLASRTSAKLVRLAVSANLRLRWSVVRRHMPGS